MVGKALRETVPAALLHFRQTLWILKYLHCKLCIKDIQFRVDTKLFATL
jgi:hypothetical protein